MSYEKREGGRLLDRFSKGMKGTALIVLCLAVGVLLLLLSPSEDGGTPTDEPSDALAAYGEALEAMVEELCSSVEGVGACRVTITFSCGERSVYEGGKLAYTVPPAVRAVTVVCEGADAARVRSELTDMLTALFAIGANRVSILPLKN